MTNAEMTCDIQKSMALRAREQAESDIPVNLPIYNTRDFTELDLHASEGVPAALDRMAFIRALVILERPLIRVLVVGKLQAEEVKRDVSFDPFWNEVPALNSQTVFKIGRIMLGDSVVTVYRDDYAPADSHNLLTAVDHSPVTDNEVAQVKSRLARRNPEQIGGA